MNDGTTGQSGPIIDRDVIASLEAAGVLDRERIKELMAKGDADRQRISDLEAAGAVDRQLIATLQAEGGIDRAQIEHLRQALLSARRIGAAVGIIMARRDCDEVEAFALLSMTSQNSNRKLRDVADVLVTSLTLP